MNEHIVARKTLEHMAKNSIEPTPMTFSVWFLYYRGQNKALIARMKSLLSAGKPISQESYEKLYEIYVLKTYFKESLGITRSTTQIIDKANDLKSKIQDFVVSIQGHQENLGDMRESLTIAETREAVEIILSEAVMELKAVEANSVETSMWMQKNVKELQSVQNEVVEIEHNMSRDFLTGLPDKSYFEKNIQQLLKDSMSGVVSKCHFIVFDIEDLDHYNTTFSWLLGDSIIRLVVKLIQHETEESWQMMRHDDDSFIVIPPPTFAIHQIPDYIQRIRNIVHAKQIKVKSESKEIRNVSLNAGIIKVAVYDELRTVDQKIDKALKLIKLGDQGKIVMIDE